MNDTTEVWTPLLFVLSFNTALICIQYGFEFARWIWKNYIGNFTSDGNGHRAKKKDIETLKSKFHSDAEAHRARIAKNEEAIHLKRLRLSWLKWEPSHEAEFQCLLNTELFWKPDKHRAGKA